ncbi:hypothetical protein N7I30_21045 [Aurantimonas litoralis]|nr:hypothetical protein [Aurantimonas litoralis]
MEEREKAPPALRPGGAEQKRGKAIIEYVSGGLAMITGGVSELVMKPIRDLIEKRLQTLEEMLVQELRDGLIDEEAIIHEEQLASFILRVRRAAAEGVSIRKLRIMARYFFRNAPTEHFEEDTAAEYATITEQLSDRDMRVLAVLKRAREQGIFNVSEEGHYPRLLYELDTVPIFADARSFNEAALALVRFGFIDMASAFGGLALFPTYRCLDYVDTLDLEILE